MLLLGERLTNIPILSLQMGGKIAQTATPVIDPRNLTIIAYRVSGHPYDHHPSYVRIADVRELSNLGMIIDSEDEIVGDSDVIKLKEVLDFAFDLVGMKVVDTRGKKLGKVEDYTVDTDSFVIQQLAIKGGLFSALSRTGHMVHRSQITEINDTAIVVKSGEITLNSLETSGEIHRTYTNPFRSVGEPQPEASTIDQAS